jgi:hypothetical protein
VKERTESKFLQAQNKECGREVIKVSWLTGPWKWAVAVGKLVLIDRDADQPRPSHAINQSPAISSRQSNDYFLFFSFLTRFPHANSSPQRQAQLHPTVHHAVTIT